MFADEMEDDSIAVFFSGPFLRDTCDQLVYPFSIDRNFYYMTGLDGNDQVLLLRKSQNQVSECLFILPVDEHYEKWQALMLRPPEAKETSGIENVFHTYEFEREVCKRIYNEATPAKVYLHFGVAAAHEPLTPSQAFAKRFRKLYPSAEFINSQPILAKLRGKKHPGEVAEIRRAVDLAAGAMTYMAGLLTPGIFEYQIKAHYQHYLYMRGSAPRFRSVVAAGKNAAILHYSACDCETRSGDLVLVDAGALSNWYLSDLTRTFPVSGKFSPRQRAFYNIVLEAELKALDKMAAGVSEYEINAVVCEHYAQALKSMKLIKDASEVSRYYYHGSGHPIGLDLHEFRFPDRLLCENCVHTIEPGLYIAEEGFGIRIEDNVLVTKNGVEILSSALPKKPEEIEELVGKTLE
jgi:Xaa-Pro aminopeptidase